MHPGPSPRVSPHADQCLPESLTMIVRSIRTVVHRGRVRSRSATIGPTINYGLCQNQHVFPSCRCTSIPSTSPFSSSSTLAMPLAFQVANLAVKPPKVGENGYQGFNPRKETLKMGYQSRDGARALSEDMIVEHDVAVKVRDGCTLYCDIYRPVGSDSGAKVPAIVAWSPFGKKHTGIDMMSKVGVYRKLRDLAE